MSRISLEIVPDPELFSPAQPYRMASWALSLLAAGYGPPPAGTDQPAAS